MSNLSFVNHRDEFISNMMAMLTGGTSNDVKIVLSDGEILANKDVLSAQSDYFATMFSNNKRKFIEGETRTVHFSHCSKNIMERIVKYLFSGEMKLYDMSLSDLVTMLNITNMMMLDALKGDIQKHLLERTENHMGDSFLDLVKSLMLAEQLKLDTIKTAIIRLLYKSIEDVAVDPNFKEAMKQISCNLFKEILLYGETKECENDDEVDLRKISTKDRFDAFVLWLSQNECTDEDKKEITDSFNFDDFNERELLTDVRKSGLYSTEKIDKRVLDIFSSREQKQIRDLRKRDAIIYTYYKKSEHQEKKILKLTKEIETREKLRNTYNKFKFKKV